METETINADTIEEQSSIIREIVKETDEYPEALMILTEEDVEDSFPIEVKITTEQVSGYVHLTLYEDDRIEYLAQIPYTGNPRELQERTRMVRRTAESFSKEISGEYRSYEDSFSGPVREEYFLIYYIEYDGENFNFQYY
jgi:hypothetical protein